eukprot:3044_1
MRQYSENHMHSLHISPNCSLTTTEMIYRKNYGVKTFKDIINKSINNKYMLMKQSNWCIIIDCMLQNLSSQQNHTNKIHFLSKIKEWTANTIKPQNEYRVIEFKSINIAPYFQNPGCFEFFQAIGFMQIENQLMIFDLEPEIINVALATVTNKIKLLNMYQQLGSLWNNFIVTLQK